MWKATPVLEKAARVTPYAIVLVGALVSASGIHVRGVFDTRIAVLADEYSATIWMSLILIVAPQTRRFRN